ncbi:MAG: ribonuclease R [Bacilli bacterium]
MKDKILSILRNAQRSLDTTTIMNKINSSYTGTDLEKLMDELNNLVLLGEIVERKDGAYMPVENSKYLKGKIQVIASGNAFLLLDKKDMFISEQRLNGAENGDEVLAELLPSKNGKIEGRVVRVVKKNLGGSLAIVHVIDNKQSLSLLKGEQTSKIELINNEENKKLVEGQIIKFEIKQELSKNNYLVDVVSVVGNVNAPDIDILTICAEKDVRVEFPNEVLEEAKNMPSSITEEDKKNRIDLTDKCIFTIDGLDTKDIDDAISIEVLPNNNYLLGVHIADVSYYVKEGSKLKDEAFLRGNSVYLADRVIPMLPVELSNGICSLNPSADRCATTCEMEIDKNGNIVSSKIYKSIIRSRKKMAYTYVNQLFAGNTPDDYKEYEQMLLKMLELSKILQINKKKRGEIDFVSSEAKLIVDENGKVTEVEKREEGLGEKLIEDFMIAANETVATTINKLTLPFIYRVHDTPEGQKIKDLIGFFNLIGYNIKTKFSYGNIKPYQIQSLLDELKNSKSYEVFNSLLLSRMQKAIYDVQNRGHFGLASVCYTHFTSPIRRFSDLMVHFFLDEYLFKNNRSYNFTHYYKESLPFICEHISSTERIAVDTERSVDDLKIAEYMMNHIGDEYTVNIDGFNSKGMFVTTKNLIGGFISLDTLKGHYSYKEEIMSLVDSNNHIVYSLGDELKVKCINASKETKHVDFTLIGE